MEETQTYGSDVSGLRDAAAALTEQRQDSDSEAPAEAPALPNAEATDPVEADAPEGPVDAEDSTNVREAGKRLAEYRREREQAEAEQRSALDAIVRDTEGDEAPADASQDQREPLEDPAAETARIASETFEEATAPRWAAQARVAAVSEMLGVALQNNFPEVKTEADAIRLAHANPERFQEFMKFTETATQVMNGVTQSAKQADAEADASYSSFGQIQDAQFAKDHPEFQDPVYATATAQDTLKYFEAKGIDPDTVRKIWNQPLGIPIRDARVQAIIYDAQRYWKAQQSAEVGRRQGARANLPPVQRPGVARGINIGAEEAMRGLDGRLSQTGKLRDAAKLRAAQLRAQRRGK